jgi:hypothetical protein
MARRANKDTFGIEPIYGNTVRRFIKAGSVVPVHYQDVPEEDTFEDGITVSSILGTPPPTPPPDQATADIEKETLEIEETTQSTRSRRSK